MVVSLAGVGLDAAINVLNHFDMDVTPANLRLVYEDAVLCTDWVLFGPPIPITDETVWVARQRVIGVIAAYYAWGRECGQMPLHELQWLSHMETPVVRNGHFIPDCERNHRQRFEYIASLILNEKK